MKVFELVDLLKTMPQDNLVVARGYENGWNSIDEVETAKLVKQNGSWYDGEYENAAVDAKNSVEAVTII